MFAKLKKIDAFTRNIIVVFASASLLNFLNLLFQLLIAHKLTSIEFAGFNSLLSVFMLFSVPLGTLQLALAKYISAFNARGEEAKISYLFLSFFKAAFICAVVTLAIFCLGSAYLMSLLKIESAALGYIFAALIASAWLSPVFLGALQGLELFWWLSAATVISGALKLGLAFVFIILSYNISGAMAALLISALAAIAFACAPLKRYFVRKSDRQEINFKEIFTYLFPVAIAYFCFTAITTFDMVLVRYYFSQQDSGAYALAQMIGKIFLFLPGAISVVMFPRTSGLHAKNQDTRSTLKKSLFYVFILAIIATIFYNVFPGFVLTVLTGKAYPESIILGRLFSVSMTFYTLLFILVTYFLSVRDLRFIKFLAPVSLAQVVGIMLFHPSLLVVQAIMCFSSILLFFVHLRLIYRK
jgi:O-antigen/teichoic acid export membrane protein